jgi:hypothetical protein
MEMKRPLIHTGSAVEAFLDSRTLGREQHNYNDFFSESKG